MVAFVALFDACFDLVQGLCGIEVRPEHDLVHLLDSAPRLGVESRPPQPDRIGAMALAGVALDDHVGRDVFDHAGHASDERHRADHAFLVYAAQSAQGGAVFDVDVARERGAIGHDDEVADVAIVRNVRVGHHEAGISDGCGAVVVVITGHGAGADGDVLPQHVVVADAGAADQAFFVFEILGEHADLASAEDAVVLADDGAAGNHAVRAHDRAGADGHGRADDGVGLHLHVIGEFGFGVDDSGWMNCHVLSVLEQMLAGGIQPSTKNPHVKSDGLPTGYTTGWCSRGCAMPLTAVTIGNPFWSSPGSTGSPAK